MTLRNEPRSLFDREIVARAIRDSVLKLNPRRMARNPVMFVVEVGSVLVTVLAATWRTFWPRSRPACRP